MINCRVIGSRAGQAGRWLLVLVASLGATLAAGGEPEHGAGISFTGSGFLTLAAGRVLNGGDPQPNSGFNCPCFVSDFAQTGVYESGKLTPEPDSKLGLQGTMQVTPRFSVTGQFVRRGANGGQSDFEWLYASQKLGDRFTLQVGRKRLPLFFYSESQDVGLSYPWIHLSPQLYGWEIVNYNGANLMFSDGWGDWSARMNVFGGSETSKNSGYWKIYNGRASETTSRWSGIRGVDLSLAKDWLDARLVYVQTMMQNTTPPGTELGIPSRQHIYGMSLHAEHSSWYGHVESLYIDRMQNYGRDYTQLLALGYRIGPWMPLVTYSNYTQKQRLDPDANWHPAQSEAHRVVSLSLRYDLTSSSALKIQYDRWMNKSRPEYFTSSPNAVNPPNSANLLAVSYDLVF